MKDFESLSQSEGFHTERQNGDVPSSDPIPSRVLSKDKPLLPAHAFLQYSISAIALLMIAPLFQGKGFVTAILITQYILILLPPLAAAKFIGVHYVTTFRLNPVSLKNVVISVFMLLFALPFIGSINAIYVFLLKFLLGSIPPENIPIAQDVSELFLYFFLICLTAGICEEILFRGFIMKGLEKFGTKRAILISSVLFGFMHARPEKLPATILLGIIIGYAVYRTNSIYTGMTMHIVNNSFATFMAFLLLKYSHISSSPSTMPLPPDMNMPGMNGLEKWFAIAALVGVVCTVAFLSTIAFFLYRYLQKNTGDGHYKKFTPFSNMDFVSMSLALPGILFIGYYMLKNVLEIANLEFLVLYGFGIF